MIHHTMIVSFNDEIPSAELETFLSEMESFAREAGLTGGYAAERHLRIPADDHAPVMAATAIVQFAAPDLATLNAAFTGPDLEEFIGHWQARYPYRVVWANHEPLRL